MKARLVREKSEPLGIELDFSLPSDRVIRMPRQTIDWRGKPQQNTYVVRFNRTVRCEWLPQHHWHDLDEVQAYGTSWM